jgi:hypothetical protein
MMADTLTDGLTNCARCGGDHVDPPLTWRKFTRPVRDAQLGDFTYWATCPTTGDPVLLLVKDELTSDDLTKIARDAFAKQTTG